MADRPKLKLVRYGNGELFTTITDDRDKRTIEDYVNGMSSDIDNKIDKEALDGKVNALSGAINLDEDTFGVTGSVIFSKDFKSTALNTDSKTAVGAINEINAKQSSVFTPVDISKFKITELGKVPWEESNPALQVINKFNALNAQIGADGKNTWPLDSFYENYVPTETIDKTTTTLTFYGTNTLYTGEITVTFEFDDTLEPVIGSTATNGRYGYIQKLIEEKQDRLFLEDKPEEKLPSQLDRNTFQYNKERNFISIQDFISGGLTTDAKTGGGAINELNEKKADKSEIPDISNIPTKEDLDKKQDKLTSENAGNNVTITEDNGVIKINSSGSSSGGGIQPNEVDTVLKKENDKYHLMTTAPIAEKALTLEEWIDQNWATQDYVDKNSLWKGNNPANTVVSLKNGGDIDMLIRKIKNVSDPTDGGDAVNKKYADTKQSELTSANAGDNITITKTDGVTKINSTAGGSGGITIDEVRTDNQSFNYPLDTTAKNIIGAINEINSKPSGGVTKEQLAPVLTEYENSYQINQESPIFQGQGDKAKLDTWIDSKANKSELDNKADKSEIPNISNLATKDEVALKQDELIAGQNITITGNEISAAGTDNFYGYVLFKSVDVNANQYVFEEFDNEYWHLFNIEYEPIANVKFAGSLERPASITLDIKDSNVMNDQANTSSATAVFDGLTKTLQVLSWDSTPKPRKILHLNIFRKQLFKADVNYETKTDHKADIDSLTTTINNKADKTELPDVSQLATKEELNTKQDKITAANGLTFDGTNKNQIQMQSNERMNLENIKNAGGQEQLIDAVTIKTINGNSILGEGDLQVSGGGSWIEGEYKYMPLDVATMPEGWKKVSFGLSTNIVLSSNVVSQESQNFFAESGDKSFSTTSSLDRTGFSIKVSDVSISNVLLTLIKSQLWQYDPKDKYSDSPDVIYVGEESHKNFGLTQPNRR